MSSPVSGDQSWVSFLDNYSSGLGCVTGKRITIEPILQCFPLCMFVYICGLGSVFAITWGLAQLASEMPNSGKFWQTEVTDF